MEAPRHPFNSDKEKSFHLDFGVRESKDGTEEKPVLFYERNGFVFKAMLDIIQNTVDVQIEARRPESLERDWQVLLPDVEALAQEELQIRREKYSEYFA